MSSTAGEPVVSDNQRQLGPWTGALLIIANMVGVGVFTTAGFTLAALKSAPAVLAAWCVGGIAALCGGFTYAELGAALPRNGGEYNLLSRIYHPALGFIAGWVALVVGFSAPLALYGHIFGDYLSQLIPGVPALAAGISLIIVFVVVHSISVGHGARVHNAVTVGKVCLILVFIALAMVRGDFSRPWDTHDVSTANAIWQPEFAVQLVWVSFSYSGWNAAAYLAGEFRNPSRNLPVAIMLGTAVVMLFYLGLNLSYLMAAPAEAISGKEDVARIAATHLLGSVGGKLTMALIAIGLVSTVSANLFAGPRVHESIGKDYPTVGFLALRRTGGGPIIATILQGIIAIGLLLSASFNTLTEYIGVTLSMSAMATVAGVYVLRWRSPNLPRPYRTWGYPITPALFLILEGWMVFHALRTRPMAAKWVFGTLALGVVIYLLVRGKRSTVYAESSSLPHHNS